MYWTEIVKALLCFEISLVHFADPSAQLHDALVTRGVRLWLIALLASVVNPSVLCTVVIHNVHVHSCLSLP